jgi:DNA-binding transcriptional regulator GbsR (MarR family)
MIVHSSVNYMTKQETAKIQQFADLVGDFIRYWGFRKIHGEIWTVVYLSSHPMSGTEIVELLKVSKALVSPALKELEAEGLIFQTESENSKTKRYSAPENINKIIQNVLRRREKPMMKKIETSYEELVDHVSDKTEIDQSRLHRLGKMISTAQMGLLLLAETDQFWN